MDRLVKPDVKELELIFHTGQNCTVPFKLINLLHTMSVAVSLTTTNPALFSVDRILSIIPPLSSASYTLILSQPSDEPPFSATPDVITVRAAMLPTGKANRDDLRRLFARPGPHVFRDAVIPVSLVGPHVAEFLILRHTQIAQSCSLFKKSLFGCSATQLTMLLRSACESGNADFVIALIDAGGDVNFKDSNGQSLMPLAIRTGNIDIVKILVVSGCRINNSVDRVLHEAAAMNRVDFMEILVKFLGNIDVNSVDSDGRTPIHVGALYGHVKVIEFCLSVGGNPDVVDFNGWTPFHCAASEGHLKAVECLTECSNVKYAVNKDGKTAFSLAVDNGHSHLLDLLQWGDVLLRAARTDDVHGMKCSLAEGALVNRRDQNGWTPLHWAAFKDRIKSVKLLLEHEAEVDTVDDAGYTPLHCAVEAGHLQVALLLIAHGSKVNTKS
ncbi:hypothetical protein L6164_010151 [Bauhinia variegata]|uniref:Uncharacterized protein n=1 Tax=Bauhinia variegata TaxID=167791 RepID=A0ACB9PMA8_BAUVA|nr:hypothetical protein L6164_010151 [Bauhinia variegata]